MKHLKIVIAGVLFCLSLFTARGQHLDFQFGAGIGSSYLIETWTNGTNMNYYPTQSYFGALRLTPDSSYFNLKIMFQFLNTNFTEDINGRYNRNGDVVSFTSFIVAEHLKIDKQFNLGYDFGAGYTVETLNYNSSGVYNLDEIRKYASIRVGLLASLRTGKRSRLSLEPTLFWSDIANSFIQSNWKVAAEDISFLVNLTYSYRLF